ncbi:Cof-type HAD-IIB family hydrolase [Salipaludibacillus sp. CF4.18]|uniref:Cof-type HAD-IIB family hydrolase n=1 Tax=Salipaludibacillus sp. CF4.18 TaxID=3373081 RepID=UPI003EE61850
MNRIDMIATDMDGTLLNDGRNVSKANVEAILEAQKAGKTVIVATGRDYTEALSPLKEAGLRLPLICANGADIRREDGKVLHQQTLSDDQFKTMAAMLREEDIYFEIYTSKGAFTDNEKKGLELVIDLLETTGEFSSKEEATKLAEKRFEVGAINRTESYESVLEEENTELFKILAFSTDDVRRNRVKDAMELNLNVAISASAKDNLEITHKDATKGKGIEVMASYYGIDVLHTMVIGDNFNDVSMMEVAGFPVAMGNAEDEIKKICKLVTATNVQDGVAKAIQTVIPHMQK